MFQKRVKNCKIKTSIFYDWSLKIFKWLITSFLLFSFASYQVALHASDPNISNKLLLFFFLNNICNLFIQNTFHNTCKKYSTVYKNYTDLQTYFEFFCWFNNGNNGNNCFIGHNLIASFLLYVMAIFCSK